MAISQLKTNHNKLTQMPNKLRKAIGAVKDQTSISLAKVSGGTTIVNLEIPILKATSHDDAPIDKRHLDEILQVIATNRVYAAACAQMIGKRVGKTRNWIVALKSLVLVLRIFQEGDVHFPKEVRRVMRTGAIILNLSNFRDDSNSRPWDHTSFVRAFALYLDERLDCLLSGKLHRLRLCSYRESENSTPTATAAAARASHHQANNGERMRDMKPTMLIDRISYWQKLLDRAIAVKPTGVARTNKLVQSSLHAVVQESFDLYRDISDGLALLLDSFFHLQYQSCVNAFQACVRALKQFEELGEFYGLCKSIGVGRTSEYPSVQKVSSELIETLQEFLKDQAAFPSRSPTLAPIIDRALALASVSTSSGKNSACTGSIDDDNDNDDHRESNNFGSDFLSSDCQDKQEENSRNYGGWETSLASSTATELPMLQQNNPKVKSNGPGSSTLESLFYQESQRNNPFLQDGGDLFFRSEVGPTFRARNSEDFNDDDGNSTVPPTFCARNSDGNDNVDPFESFGGEKRSRDGVMTIAEGCDCEEKTSFVPEQQLWLENQKKIIAKRKDAFTLSDSFVIL